MSCVEQLSFKSVCMESGNCCHGSYIGAGCVRGLQRPARLASLRDSEKMSRCLSHVNQICFEVDSYLHSNESLKNNTRIYVHIFHIMSLTFGIHTHSIPPSIKSLGTSEYNRLCGSVYEPFPLPWSFLLWCPGQTTSFLQAKSVGDEKIWEASCEHLGSTGVRMET